MKRIISVFVSLLLTLSLLASFPASAVDVIATGKCGDNLTWSLDSDGVLTISGTGPMDYSDTSGYYQTYKSWTYSEYVDQIKEVVIEEGVTTIGPCAFGRTSSGIVTDEVAYPNLKKISLPSTIETICRGAFLATVIENLTVPENVKEIASHAYQYSLIKSVTINDGVILNASSFSDCKALKEVTVGANIHYGHGAGWGSENHSESIFSNCEALEKVTILGAGTVRQRFTTIENGLPNTMCYGCTSLKEVRLLCKDLAYVGKVNSGSMNTETFPTSDTNITYYVYKDSTTESTLKTAGYLTDENVIYFAETEALEEAISKAEEIDTTKYTEETVSALTSALDGAKAVLENQDATQAEVDDAEKAINDAISQLKEKTAPTEPSSDPTDNSSNSTLTNNTQKDPTNKPTAAKPTKSTRNAKIVASEKKSASKAMKQAKLTSLKAKSKGKKINVSWKKVKKAVGYEVQVSTKKNFKKVIFKKDLKKTKLTIKNKKIKSKKTYFVRVRAYATYKDANNKVVKVYSKWNKKLRNVKVK